MPNVGGKKFAYTPEGEAAAAEYAQQIGAPFQMRAKAFNNSPMQKNFGKDLAINKKLDSNAGPILKKTGVTSKLEKSNMEGGLTGKVGLGKLDGPLKFTTKGIDKPKKWNDPSNIKTRAAHKSKIGDFFKGLKGSMKDLSYQVSSKSSKEKMKSGGYTPYKDRKAAVKAGTHSGNPFSLNTHRFIGARKRLGNTGYSGALGALKGAEEKFKVKPKKDESISKQFIPKEFKGKKGDPYKYRTTKSGGYEYSKGKKWTPSTSKKGTSAIDKLFKSLKK